MFTERYKLCGYVQQKKNDRYLMHFGIPKMQWGIRRFQNYDGTLTPEGRERYGYGKHERYLKDEIENSWMYKHNYDNFIGPREEHFSDVVERAMKTGEDISDRVLREFGRETYGAFANYDHFKDGRNYARMIMDNLLEEGFKKDEADMWKEARKKVNSDYIFDEEYDKYSNEADQYRRAKDFVNFRKHETWFSDMGWDDDTSHARDLMKDTLNLMGETSVDEIMKMYK